MPQCTAECGGAADTAAEIPGLYFTSGAYAVGILQVLEVCATSDDGIDDDDDDDYENKSRSL